MESKKKSTPTPTGNVVEVIRGIRDVEIAEDPLDAKGFAEKYGVDWDDGGAEGRPEASAAGDMAVNQDLVKRTEGLVRRLDEKNREVERLCVLLEAVEIVPGMNPDRVLAIYDNSAEEPIDLRDSKIVHLAKKVRSLTMTLNKERSLKSSVDTQKEELKREIEQLKEDLKLVSSPAARAAARGEGKDHRVIDGSAVPKDARKDLAAASKQVRRSISECYHSLECTHAVRRRWRICATNFMPAPKKIKGCKEL